jgi:hypothetical protein
MRWRPRGDAKGSDFPGAKIAEDTVAEARDSRTPPNRRCSGLLARYSDGNSVKPPLAKSR